MTLTISHADLDAPDFAELVQTHADFCDATAPPESCHRLPVDTLRAPDIVVWAARDGDTLLGIAALKQLSPTRGEVKSMHTAAAARGKGVARALVDTLMAEARARSYDSLWLETGVHPDFAPARALYMRYGFSETGPFGDYVLDPHSVFMRCDLKAVA